MSEYTQVRIKKVYLAKLDKLAKSNKRSMANMIEVLIDQELAKIDK